MLGITTIGIKTGIGIVRQGAHVNLSEQFNNGKLVLNFDDGATSMYTDALPLFVEKGVTATIWANGIFPDANGGTGTANFCTWTQLQAMYAAGIDIQCHTYSHIRCTEKTDGEIATDLLLNNTALLAYGIPAPTCMAWPEGLYDARTKSAVAPYRKMARCSAPNYVFTYRSSDKYALTSFWLDNGTDATTVTAKSLLDGAKANKAAILMSAHGVSVAGSSATVKTSRLTEIIDYALSIGVDIISAKQLETQMMHNEIFVEPSTNLTITSTGTGAGVANLVLDVTEDTTFTIVGNARFYTDAGGIANESNTWYVKAGHGIIYIKCSSGVSTITVGNRKLYKIESWTASTNAPSLGGNISLFINLVILSVTGNNNLSGSISGLIKLIKLWCLGSNTLSGSIAYLLYLAQYWVVGSNTIGGDASGNSLLTSFIVDGNSAISGNSDNMTLLQSATIAKGTFQFLRTITNKQLSSLTIGNIILASASINKILADFVANKDEAKPLTTRNISLFGLGGSSAPTGQGLTDKATLQAYHSPNNDLAYVVWAVGTR